MIWKITSFITSVGDFPDALGLNPIYARPAETANVLVVILYQVIWITSESKGEGKGRRYVQFAVLI